MDTRSSRAGSQTSWPGIQACLPSALISVHLIVFVGSQTENILYQGNSSNGMWIILGIVLFCLFVLYCCVCEHHIKLNTPQNRGGSKCVCCSNLKNLIKYDQISNSENFLIQIWENESLDQILSWWFVLPCFYKYSGIRLNVKLVNIQRSMLHQLTVKKDWRCSQYK